MKILYCILSCLRYESSRRVWQENSWIKKIGGSSNYIYLTGRGANKTHSLITPNGNDSYDDTYLKYHYFVTKYNFDQYDWCFFCDDDTFIFVDKLENILKNYDSNSNAMVGRTGILENKQPRSNFLVKCPLRFFSGGAGFAMSKSSLMHIKKYLNLNRVYPISDNSDVTMGAWIKSAKIDHHMVCKGNMFQCGSPRDASLENVKLEDIVTYHYCNEEDFANLNKLN
jgi:hypothetical protein